VIQSDTGEVIGVLDILDIIAYMQELFPWDTGVGNQRNVNINSKRWDFLLKPISDIVQSYQMHKAPVISGEAAISSAVAELAKGAHYLLVVPKELPLVPLPQKNQLDSVSGLITQSDIIRFMAENVMWLTKPSYDMTIEELGLIMKEVVTVPDTMPAFEAFKLINQHYIHGVGVVDKDGKLVGNLSASNIKGITRRSFQVLRLPVREFLERDRRRMWWFVPICTKENDTLKQVILQFAATQKHRFFLVDKDDKPTGVITLTDVLKVVTSIEPINILE